jgi:S1-C subfamily serine protease
LGRKHKNIIIIRDRDIKDTHELLAHPKSIALINKLQNPRILVFKNTKQISRPAFGFSYSIITPNENRLGGLPEGALVKNVEAVSAARRGGLLLGDVIVSVDGNKISENSLLEELLNKYSAGSQVNLSVRRGKQDISLVLTAAELKP